MKFKFAIIIFLTYSLIGCKKSVIEPTAAEAISGTYEAKTYHAFDDELTYPINSQTIRIQIDAVSKDTVRVQVNSSINGFYSPGESAIYPKVFVKETVGSNLQYRKSYQIFLAPPTRANASKFYRTGVFLNSYAPIRQPAASFMLSFFEFSF